jgi:hypothetical protein
MARVVITVRFVDAQLVDATGKGLGAKHNGLVGTTIDGASGGVVTAVISTTQGMVTFELPLAAFDAATATASVAGELPITGFPQDFPGDHYNLWAISWLSVPDGVFVQPPSRAPASTVSTHTYYEVGTGLSYWRARTDTKAAVSTDPRLLHEPGVELYRPDRYLSLIWAICTIPPALLALYWFLAIAGKGRRSTSHFELGVATLALIALRQFFAPSIAIGFTTLDHFLAAVLAGSVLLSASVALVQALDDGETAGPTVDSGSESGTTNNIGDAPPTDDSGPAAHDSGQPASIKSSSLVLTRFGRAVVLSADKHDPPSPTASG